MAQLRTRPPGGFIRDNSPEDNPTPDSPGMQATPTPTFNPGGAPPGGTGTGLKPIELNPGKTPTTPGNRPTNTPQVGTEPIIGGEPRSFLGGGNSTVSPPSVTQQAPFTSMSSPEPESMVFPQGGGKGLFGNSGGMFGGGLGLGGAQSGSQDPSSLILSLLQLLHKG